MSDRHSITLDLASKLTFNYRLQNLNDAIATKFDKEAFHRVLNQQGCVGIRCYYAVTNADSHPSEPGMLTLVMVGVDIDGNDLFNGELMEMGDICPINCAQENPLNA